MRTLLALFATLLVTAAQAQQRQPANVSTLPTSAPQEFDLLDKTGAWVPFGQVDSASHTISLVNALDPRSFGAKCDGTTDDTTALAAWAAAIKDGSVAHVVGKCVTKQPIVFPLVDHVALTGDGIGTSQLIYAGTSTTVTAFTFGTTGTNCQIRQWTIADLSFESTTKMTAGYAVEISELCLGFLHHLEIGNQFGGNINWWSGLHLNGGNTVKVYGLSTKGQDTGNIAGGVGITVNGDTFHQFTDPNFLGVTIVGYKTAINIAGFVGGFVMDFSDILLNDTQVRISQDIIPVGNNQIFFGPTTFLDQTWSGPEVDLVDPGGTQPFLTFNGTWLATSFSHGLFVHAGTSWNILMNGGFVYNIGRQDPTIDGIHNESTTGKIWVNGTRFGATGGYCVNSTVANSNIVLQNPIFPLATDSQHCGTNYNNTNITPVTSSDYYNGGELRAPALALTGGGLANVTTPTLGFVPINKTGPADQNDWDIFENGVDQSLDFRAVSDNYSASNQFAKFTRGSGYSLGGGASFILNVPGVASPTLGTNAAFTVSGTDNVASPTSGGNLKLTNSGTGATTPSKTLRVAQAGQFQVLNDAYTVALMSVDDVGNGTFAINGGGPQALSRLAPLYRHATLRSKGRALTLAMGRRRRPISALCQRQERSSRPCSAMARFGCTTNGLHLCQFPEGARAGDDRSQRQRERSELRRHPADDRRLRRAAHLSRAGSPAHPGAAMVCHDSWRARAEFRGQRLRLCEPDPGAANPDR